MNDTVVQTGSDHQTGGVGQQQQQQEGTRRARHLTQFGLLEATTDGTSLRDVTGWAGDPDPRQIIHNVANSQHHPCRITRPAVREGRLKHGPGGSGRGDEPFVELDWDEALDLVAGELQRVYGTRGSSGVYGGSYGWSSAGRFHHSQASCTGS